MYGLKIDCENYLSRKPAFMNDSSIVGVEVHLMPRDYDEATTLQHHFDQIAKIYSDLHFFSIHYPWQYTYTSKLFQEHIEDLEFTIESLMKSLSAIEPQTGTLVIHCQHEFPASYYELTDPKLRLQNKAELLETTNKLMGVTFKLLEKSRTKWGVTITPHIAIENNPTVGDNVLGYSDQCAEDILYHLDALPELMHTFDISHIVMAMIYFGKHENEGPLPNMEVIRDFYDGVPTSLIPDLSFENYFDAVIERITQVHVSGCSGYLRQNEGIDLDAKNNIVDLKSFINKLPPRVCIIPERKQSYRDLRGDIRTLELIKQGIESGN